MYKLTNKFYKYKLTNKDTKITSIRYIAKAKRKKNNKDIVLMLKELPDNTLDFSWADDERMDIYYKERLPCLSEQDFEVCNIKSKQKLLKYLEINKHGYEMFEI